MLACSAGSASPSAAHHWLGVVQWYSLLNGPLLSIFDAVYRFTAKAPDTHVAPLSANVQCELLGAALLSTCWRASPTRRFLPMVGATDASSTFGTGAAIAPLAPATVRELVGTVARHRHVALLRGRAPPPASVGRIGKCIELPLDCGLPHVV